MNPQDRTDVRKIDKAGGIRSPKSPFGHDQRRKIDPQWSPGRITVAWRNSGNHHENGARRLRNCGKDVKQRRRAGPAGKTPKQPTTAES